LPGTATASASERDREDALAWVREVEEIVTLTTGRTVQFDVDALAALPEDARIEAAAARLVDAGLLHDGRLARGFIAVYQASVRTAYETIQVIRAPIALIKAANGDGASDADATWGWSRLTAGTVDVHVSPGAHISMLLPPHAVSLAGELAAILARA